MIIEYDYYREFAEVPNLEECYINKPNNQKDSCFVLCQDDNLLNNIANLGVIDGEAWLEILEKDQFTIRYIFQIRELIKKVYKTRYNKVKVNYESEKAERLGRLLWRTFL